MTIDQSLDHLTERATRDLGPEAYRAGIPHSFVVGAILPTEIGLAEISNFGPTGPTAPLSRTFRIAKVAAIGQGFVIATGGGRQGVTEDDMRTLGRMATHAPSKPADYSEFLAGLNARVAGSAEGQTVSKTCITAYLPPKSDGCKTKLHDPAKDATLIITVPTLLLGIDLTEGMDRFMKAFVRHEPTPDMSDINMTEGDP